MLLRPARQVTQLTEYVSRVKPVGRVMIYASKDSYKAVHGGRCPEDDHLRPQEVVLADGTTCTGYKAVRPNLTTVRFRNALSKFVLLRFSKDGPVLSW